MARKRFALLLLAPLAASSFVVAGATPASAVELTTPYPAVRVEPGAASMFDLQITSPIGEAVELSVTEAPDGWHTVLRGGGREVEAVYASADSAAEVELEVRVPADAQPGAYDVTVVARGDGGRSTLPLRLRVVEQAADAFELATEFPNLRGSSSDTFRFDLTLANHTAREGRFTLSAIGPEGWNVTASPSTEEQAATVTVDAGSTTTIAVEADPPDDVAAGSYEIGVSAEGAGTTLQSALMAEIVGSSSFTLTTVDERLNASGSAGGTSSLTLVIRNDGNAPLQNVELSATPPTNWVVDFEPATIPAVPPGQAAQAVARIRPAGDAIAGDYAVTLTGSVGGTSESIEIRYAVETSRWWGLLGIVVILLAIGALIWAYRRYGRR